MSPAPCADAETVPTPSELFSLEGKVIVLTGASSGLGHRFARTLHAAGATVVLVARRAERLAELTADLPRSLSVPVDLVAQGAPQEIVDAALAEFGRIDGIVNNAGISRVIPAIEDDIDEFRREIEIDLIAPYDLARRAAKWMIDNGEPGSIVNIGSVLGDGGGGRLKVPGYAAAKGGLHNLTRELASQWARRNVRVNAIGPGWFETEMNSGMFSTDSGRAYITDNTPMGRPGQEGELDGALLFLLSDAARYVTGQVLFVDGGWTAI